MDLTFPKFNIPKIDSFENELDQLDKPITNTMDKTFSDFKIESSMNMNFNNMNTYMGYENKNIFRVKDEKKYCERRNKTPINYNNYLDENKKTKKKNNLHDICCSIKSLIRQINKSFEPKIKTKKKNKNKKKKTEKKMNNIKSFLNKKDNKSYEFTSISHYTENSKNIFQNQQSFNTQINKSRNYCSYYSKSYDNNLKYSITTKNSFQYSFY